MADMKPRQEKVPSSPLTSVDSSFLKTLVGYNTRRATLKILSVFTERMDALALKPVEFSILSLIGRNPGLTPSQLCAELGLLVWQDAMLATFDPPRELDDVIAREVATLLAAHSGNPALAVLSGGSETLQRPEMLGIRTEDRDVPVIDQVLRDVVASRGDVVYVRSSPAPPPRCTRTPRNRPASRGCCTAATSPHRATWSRPAGYPCCSRSSST